MRYLPRSLFTSCWFLFTTTAVLTGCNNATAPAAGGPPGGRGTPEVSVVVVKTAPVTLTTELTGRAAPYQIAEVRPQVGGLIQARAFQEGAQIRAGQVLYQIDAARYRATYASAEAALARAQATQARAKLKANRYANLLRAKAVSQEDSDDTAAALKEADAEVALAQASLTAARIDLDYTQVKAPIAGRIGRSALTQGALVTANQEQALATVQQLDPIYVDLTQSSAQLLRLRQALADGRLQRPAGEQPSVTLILEDETRYPHAGRLKFSEVTVSQGTGTVTLRATFPNPDRILLPGMFVRALVEEGTRADAILIPQQAVQRDRRGNPTALVVTADNQVAQHVLQINRTQGDQWLVESGLAAGERVIVEGLQHVRPGMQVKVVEAGAAAAPVH
nr:efflux RND transporter periplasmic adaptor subunit [Thiospirillum jenense]